MHRQRAILRLSSSATYATAEKSCETAVAAPAPAMPMPRPNMSSGSRQTLIRLESAETCRVRRRAVESAAVCGGNVV